MQSSRFFLLVMLLMFSDIAYAAADDMETKVKAAYLFNFTKFVEWIGFSGDILNICVLGKSAIANVLDDYATRNTGRQFNVEHGADDLTECQVLYIDQSEKNLLELLAKVRGAKVLSVSDAENFAKNGGIIGFYIDDGKLKLEINQKVAEAANLKISSKLMEVARIVP